MLTVREFAAKIGADKSSIWRWIQEGWIPGVERVKLGKGCKAMFMIPDDAVRPETRCYRGGQTIIQQKRFLPETAAIADPKRREQLEFVANHQSWSIRSIARNLCISTGEVRELFDELLQMEGAADERETFV